MTSFLPVALMVVYMAAVYVLFTDGTPIDYSTGNDKAAVSYGHETSGSSSGTAYNKETSGRESVGYSASSPSKGSSHSLPASSYYPVKDSETSSKRYRKSADLVESVSGHGSSSSSQKGRDTSSSSSSKGSSHESSFSSKGSLSKGKRAVHSSKSGNKQHGSSNHKSGHH